MSRYYDIRIVNSQTGELVSTADGYPFNELDSRLPNLRSDPGALNIDLDLPVVAFHQPVSQGMLRIWGVGTNAIYQATNFNPTLGYDSAPSNWCDITIDGGMSDGLPLANSNQSGLLVSGSIQQAFGRWEGTDQYVEFVIVPSINGVYGPGSNTSPVNLSVNWTKGQKLSDALGLALAAGFPQADVVVSANTSIVAPENQAGQYFSLDQLANWANETSRAAVSMPNYRGYSIYPTQTGYLVWDGTVAPASTKQILFTDLIGQPTWLGPAQLTFKTVMRGDIAVGDLVQMPTVIVQSTASSFAQYRVNPSFRGTFFITAVRHMGRYRERDASAWVTAFEAVPS